MPPAARIASRAARLIAAHCSSSSPRRAGASTVKYGAAPSGYACVIRQVTTPLAERLRGGRLDRLDERRQALPRDRALERLGEHAHRHERVAQVRRAQERVAPRARRCPRSQRAAVLRRRSRARGRPARSTASKPSSSSAASRRRPASAPPRAARSAGSWTAAGRPARSRARRRARRRSPAARRGRSSAASSRGSTRTHASVMTASVPSDPSSSRSGDGPAPDAGSRRDSHTSPRAVTARIDSTRSSMCVGPVAKWPAARVASQPPSVDSSNDCGIEPQRHAVRGELRLEPRAARPGLDAGGARRPCRPPARGRAARGRATPRRRGPGRAPGRRRRRRSCRRRTGATARFASAAHSSTRASSVSLDAAARRRRARAGSARGARARRPVRGAVGVHGARVGVLGADRGQRRRHRTRGGGSATGAGASSSAEPKPRCAASPAAALAPAADRPRSPSPSAGGVARPLPSCRHGDLPTGILARGPWERGQVAVQLARGLVRAAAAPERRRRPRDRRAGGPRLARSRRPGGAAVRVRGRRATACG